MSALEYDKVRHDLCAILTRPLAAEAVVRLRANTHVISEERKHYGHFFVRQRDLVAMSVVNPESTVAVEFQFESAVKAPHLCIQAALLYTATTCTRPKEPLSLLTR